MTRRAALFSCYDKTGIVPGALALQALGFAVLASTGTAKVLTEGGVSVETIRSFTDHPPDTFAKTLQGPVFDAIFKPADLLSPKDPYAISIVCVNIYPLLQADPRTRTARQSLCQLVDVGGTALITAALRCQDRVFVLTDPADLEVVTAAVNNTHEQQSEVRKALAAKASALLAAYFNALATAMDDLGAPSLSP